MVIKRQHTRPVLVAGLRETRPAQMLERITLNSQTDSTEGANLTTIYGLVGNIVRSRKSRPKRSIAICAHFLSVQSRG
jgi:hypothetical protein